MILHLVLFTWKDGVTEAQVAELNKAMEALRPQVPELVDLRFGSDLGFRTGNASWAIAAVFKDQAGWQAYQVHPAHQAVVKDVATPMMAGRQAIQMTIPNDWKPIA